MATSITSITGLQNLSNLTKFQAVDNNLQVINVSNLSNLNDVTIIRNNLNSINLTNCAALTNLDLAANPITDLVDVTWLDQLVNLQSISFSECQISGLVDLTPFPSLETIGIDFTAVTEVIITESQPINLFDATNCQLTETAVDNILVALSVNGISGGSCYLNGTGNSAPSLTGLTAKTVLEGNGWTVDVN